MTPAQLTGRDSGLLVEVAPGQRLHPEVADAFCALQFDARAAGFELAIASAWRSFERQLAIFNGKARGERPLYDDRGRELLVADLSPEALLAAILRFSALPGASRHHWGTDLDVYDAATLAAGDSLQLSPQEVAPGGPFDPLHRWLDQRMAEDGSHGFFRPYGVDHGGVAPERWHLSYAPLAAPLAERVTATMLRECWQRACPRELCLQGALERDLEALVERYVAVPDDWCPARYRAGLV